jgi:hypothetical protein
MVQSNQTPEKKDAPSKSSTPSGGDAGQAELQARFDEEMEQGYAGVVADPTPNHAYTVAGVVAGEATPETDAEAAQKAAANLAAISAPKRGDEKR